MSSRFISAFVALLATALLAAVIGASPSAAQTSEPVVETDPPIPTADQQDVKIYFNADQGSGGLADYTGDVYAHTGVYTNQSPNEWTCVKNYWPTDDNHAGNRTDTKLERLDANRYVLTIDGRSVREFYNDNSTGCTLGANETIETMNFVFRNEDGSLEGKADGGQDIIIDLGDGNAPILADITSPSASLEDPIVVGTDTTISILAVAQTDDGSAPQEFTLSVNGTQQVTTSNDTIQYDLALTSPGRKDVVVEATDGQGNAARDSLYAVRAEPTQEEPVPSDYEEGITYTSSSSAVLVLQAPKKSFVHVIGEMTDWEVQPQFQMKRETIAQGSDVVYWTELTGLTPGKEYGFQYLVDGEIRIPDPFSEKVLSSNDGQISDETYPNLKPYPGDKTNQLVSVLQTDQSSFSFSDFQRPEQKDLVIYELLVRDFIEKHNYQTMQDTLAYLDRLGVNAIELMPVSEFDGNESWGYNPALYFAADKYYGPAEELKRFIDMAHQRGIAVILDVVYNQATGQSPLVRLYNDGTFGRPTEENPWVNRYQRHPFNVFNDNNHESSFTQYWLDRANEYWLTEFNVDGFRFDLSKGFTQTRTCDEQGENCDVGAWGAYDQSRVDLLTRMADEIWSVDPTAYVILEHFAAPDEEKVLAEYKTDQGRPGMMLWNNMNEPYSEAAMGYVDGSGLANTYYRNRGIDVPNYITYMESHDEQWMMYRNIAEGNSTDEGYNVQELETALQRQKLAGAFFYTVPGPRLMFQFGELGYGYGDNGEQCLEGAAGSCPGDAPGRTAPKPIRWDYRDPDQSPNRVRLYKTWSALINLRTSHEVFTSADTQVDLRVQADDRGRRIGLQHPSMNAVVVGNFAVDTMRVAANFPSTGEWYDFFTGKKITISEQERDAGIPMAPGEFHVFTSQPVDTPEAGIVDWGVAAPPPAPPSDVSVSSDFDAKTIGVSWTASTSTDVTGYRLYRGTTPSFDTTGAAVASLGPDATGYTDSDVAETTTYYYRVAALDDDGLTSDLTASAAGLLYPNSLSVSTSRSFGEGTEQSDYRLIALPGDVERDVAETFSGEAGDAWQVYWDDGSSTNFLQSYESSSTFTFQPGRGFWGISESAWSVDESVPTVPLSQGSENQVTVIPLHRGWNIISNPLGVDVAWSEVEAANGGDLQPIWSFTGSFSQSSTFTTATSGEAFYFNNQGDLARLQIPYVPASSSGSQTPASKSSSLLSLTAHGPDDRASTVRLGVAKGASDGVGPEDVIAPPSQFETVSLRVNAANAGDVPARQRELARSVRAPGTDGQVFDLVLRADAGTVQLSVDGAETMDAPTVRLVNRRTGEHHDLARTATVDVRTRSGTDRFTLLAGSQAFVDKETSRLAPDELKLWPNYPNPFTDQTNVEYTLPSDGQVTIAVYDLLGRRVGTLVDRRQSAGLHQVQWSGSRSLASGVYFLRLTAGGTTRTQKMTVIR